MNSRSNIAKSRPISFNNHCVDDWKDWNQVALWWLNIRTTAWCVYGLCHRTNGLGCYPYRKPNSGKYVFYDFDGPLV
jgi:hypothetical protein